MIRHLSIPATDTRRVAEALQRLLGGTITPFGPYPDSWTLWVGDEHGTAVEIYPVGTELVAPEGPGQAQFRAAERPSPFVATHVALSVRRSVEEIKALAAELGWRAVRLSRGDFEVVEFWIENHVMFELLTAEMEHDYLAAAPRSPGWRRVASGGVGWRRVASGGAQ